MTCIDSIYDVLNAIRFETIPQEVKTKAKQLLGDYLSVLIAGSQKLEAQQLVTALQGKLNTPENLACWLGSVSRLMDFDDGHRHGMGHPGVVVQSATLACAFFKPQIDGRTYIEALVRGYEMYCHLGRTVNPSAYIGRGFDSTAISGAPAAAVVAAHIMGLSEKETKNAIALAATLCGGLNQAAIDGSSQKCILAGWAAQLGITAAQMAQAGLDGPAHALEGKLGFCHAFSPTPNLEIINHPQLRYDILGVYTKKFSCVRRIHTQLDLLESIISENGLNEEDIAQVTVYGGEFLQAAAFYDPQNLAQAQTCIPYALALLMHYGHVTEEDVRSNIGNAKISDLSKIITVKLSQEFVELAQKEKSLWGAARISVTTADGRTFEAEEIYPKGEKENPFTEADLKAKFTSLVTPVYGAVTAQQIWTFVNTIDAQNIVDFSKIRLLEQIAD